MSERVDLSGSIFGKLTVISLYEIKKYKSGGSKAIWKCVCECGTIKNISSGTLKQGFTKSCGKLSCRPYKLKYDLVNQKFGFLTAKSFQRGTGKWLCECECGNISYITTGSLVQGCTRSCGCKTIEMISNKNTLPNNQAAINCIYKTYKYSASKRNLEFALNKNDFVDLINNNCYYCGAPSATNYIKT